MSITDFLPGPALDIGLRHFTRLKETGFSEGEVPYLHKSGEVRLWKIVAVRLTSVRYMAFVEDVTDQNYAEEALRESEEKYRLLADNASDLIWTCRGPAENFRMTYINPAVREMLDYTPDEFNELPIEERMTPESLQAVVEAVEEIQKSRSPEKIQVKHIHKNGSLVDCEILAKPVFDDNGEIVYFFGRTIDITERVKMLHELSVAKNMFEAVIMQSPVPMAAADTEGKILLFNDACREQLKITNIEFYDTLNEMDQTWKDYDSKGNFIPTSELPLAKALRGEVSKNVEVKVVRHDGTVRWEIASGAPIYDDAGNIVAGFAAFPDITRLKETEIKLRLSEKKFKALFDNVPIGVALHEIIVDENNMPVDFVWLDCNNAYELMSGLRRDAIVGRRGYDIIPNLEKKWIKLYGEVALTGKSCSLIDHSDYLDRFWEVHAFSPGEKLFAVAMKDVTEIKASEDKVKEELAEKKLMLKEVHHRIKNNISTIISLLSLHAAAAETEETVNVINTALGRIESMRKLYENLMFSDDYKTMPAKAYLEELIQTIMHTFPDERAVSIHTNIADIAMNAESLFALGTILNELVTNSMKYAFKNVRHGNIDITIEKGKLIQLTVADNGPGIDDSKVESPGFGIQLVKMLARQLNGEYSAVSRNGLKTVISFPFH